MPKKSFYDILGISQNAGQDEIKREYRKLAKEYHPDKHGGNADAERRFKEISEAYSVLSDPKKRQQYDQMLRYGFPGNGRGPSGTSAEGVDLSDLFGFNRGRRRSTRQTPLGEEFFGFGGLGDIFSQIFDSDVGYGANQQARARGGDIQATLEIPFETALQGGRTDFTIEKQAACPDCNGTGSATGHVSTCPECHGSGMVSMSRGAFALNRPCPRCLGKGELVAEPCKSCGGNGVVQAPKQYRLKIKPGTTDGSKVRLRGEGMPGREGQAGDLVITFQVSSHRFFKTKGLDVHCEIPLDKKKAKKGTKVRVKTVYGDTVQLNIPPNTSGSKTFKLKGMGVKSNGDRGDQYVRVRTD